MSVIINKNGRTVVVHGDYVHGKSIGSMVINGGKIIVDGKPLNELDQEDEKVINITIEGSVERLEVEVCSNITVKGDAHRVHTHCGDIDITGNVSGDVHTNCGSISCGNVEGDCHTNMGSIVRR